VLRKACEDYPKKFDQEIAGTRPLDYMIVKFLSLTEHPLSKMRSHALHCLTHFVVINSPSFNANIDNFISCLFKCASDENPDVRQTVCQSLVMLLGSRPATLLPAISDVAGFMLYSTQDKDENVALEACEFWLTFAEEPDLEGHLRPLLPRLAPVLLQCMVYSEEDLMWLQGDDENDANVPDKPSDIKPKFYGGGARSLAHDSDDQTVPSIGQALKYGQEDQLYDEDDLDFDEDDMETDWNLRKCAAAAIDVLAVRFGGQLLEVIFPHLKEKLWSDDWLQKESGILALGAMAEGIIPPI
jgi:transportin-1